MESNTTLLGGGSYDGADDTAEQKSNSLMDGPSVSMRGVVVGRWDFKKQGTYVGVKSKEKDGWEILGVHWRNLSCFGLDVKENLFIGLLSNRDHVTGMQHEQGTMHLKNKFHSSLPKNKKSKKEDGKFYFIGKMEITTIKQFRL